MRDYYYIGTARLEGASLFELNQTVIVKTKSGYLSAGHIVEFHIGECKKLARVICTSLVSAGSKDEAVLNEHTKCYEVDKIYHLSWTKEEEEKEDAEELE